MNPSALEEGIAFFGDAVRHRVLFKECLSDVMVRPSHSKLNKMGTVASLSKPKHSDLSVTFRIVQLDFMCLSLYMF